ncbi:CGNR zinc finger domain-containing protein [Streptomyces sp. NPDC048172]|uniref:CGNR zinc finger domain-containing protein n=1 Tax=Streptomyces sp. NPDC048172 TaxID=3365505 RepID=UPI00371D944F
MFDSHVTLLLDAAVSLVNALTDGQRRGKPYTAPRGGDDLTSAVAAALPSTGTSSPPAPPAPLDPEDVECLARTAREMRHVFEAAASGDLDAAADTLNGLLRSTGARPQLDRAPGEPWQVHFHGSEDSPGVGWSAGCAAGLALAAGSDLAGRLGVCQAPRCDRVFTDTSRNGTRQFCSTACQSRVKAAAHRARRTAADSGKD